MTSTRGQFLAVMPPPWARNPVRRSGKALTLKPASDGAVRVALEAGGAYEVEFA